MASAHVIEADEENEEVQDERLSKLAGFQLMMIKHAMKCEYTSALPDTPRQEITVCFPVPGVVKIVYSTCSIHAVENEEVVCHALSSDEASGADFVLASRDEVLPNWKRRGMPEKMTKGGQNIPVALPHCYRADRPLSHSLMPFRLMFRRSKMPKP